LKGGADGGLSTDKLAPSFSFEERKILVFSCQLLAGYGRQTSNHDVVSSGMT
jgi:hypothetical protein